VRETQLKKSSDGYYRRNIGYHVPNGTGRVTQPKISLGKNYREAVERLSLIKNIWKRIELDYLDEQQPLWDDTSLAIAKAIGQGKPDFPVAPIEKKPERYVYLLESYRKVYPEIRFRPSDEDFYRAGLKEVDEGERLIEMKERAILEKAATMKEVVLASKGNELKCLDLLDEQTLHQALDSYSEYLAVEYYDKTEAAISDTGKRKQYMATQLKSYLADRPLKSIRDQHSTDEVFGTLRQRPVTKRYGKPMSHSHSSHLISELDQFFVKWLHPSPHWDWSEPSGYHRVSRKPVSFEADVEHDSKEVAVYSMEQLGTLYRYATPLERLLLLLGINCAYGADQIGRLKLKEVNQGDVDTYIMRTRRKKRVRGQHYLFPQTVQGIHWATENRATNEDSLVLVNKRGNSLYRKTKGGNRSRDIPNAWYRLLDRIQKDHADFPRLGFNALRDTSATLIRDIAGQEIASLQLTHKHQSTDRNLRRYTNPPFERLFNAQRELEQQLIDAGVFELEGDAWEEREHQYVTEKQKAVMRSLSDQGASVATIAQKAGVSKTTVYRWVGPKTRKSQE
jgi:hypothetical protein